ncbi:CASP-like protein 1D1 isoform X2 [Hevea brasiliensis]|uniref:CASP-like protein 1D1 isoform X2 n=1 Tax=Hevea brasiliensis TaxID=3981 RepID=UPI0025DBA4D3|nr:CASP-like protein 1D1 isoform X2 [Hevea brasiliensis]
MASTGTDKPDPEAATKSEVPHPPPKGIDYFAVDVGLRVLLFAATLTAVVVMSTAKQTEPVFVPGAPVRVPIAAKFNHSPAFIYFVAALSVACLYSIITALASLGVIAKPIYATKFLLHYAFWDVLILGIVAAATGAAGGVAYIGLKGNSHTRWTKVCNVYDEFCRHVGSSIAIALFASVLLVLLIMLSVFSLHSRIQAAGK